MKKPFKFTETDSTKRCKGKRCNKPLKKNLLFKKPDAELCYACTRKKRVLEQKKKDNMYNKLNAV